VRPVEPTAYSGFRTLADEGGTVADVNAALDAHPIET
jgi:hypothetical protein